MSGHSGLIVLRSTDRQIPLYSAIQVNTFTSRAVTKNVYRRQASHLVTLTRTEYMITVYQRIAMSCYLPLQRHATA